MVVVFTEINYLVVSLFFDLVLPIVFIFVVLSSLAVLFAFPAWGQKGPSLPQRHLPYSSRSPSGQLIFNK